MPKTEVNGVVLHYQRTGRGPDLVLIHGLFSNLAFWYLSVVPSLAREFRVTVYDLRGHGLSGMTQSGYTSAGLASDLRALLDVLGIERAHVAGHSFGGAVALHLGLLHADRVNSITLADARLPCFHHGPPARDEKGWGQLRRALDKAGIQTPRQVPRVAFSYFEELARLPPTTTSVRGSLHARALLSGWQADSPVAQRWSTLLQSTTAAREFAADAGLTAERIRTVQHPSLVMFGERSPYGETLEGLQKNLPHCTRQIVPGVGHFHPILRPDRFVHRLRTFIRSCDESRSRSREEVPSADDKE